MTRRPRITATWKDQSADFIPIELRSNEEIIGSCCPMSGALVKSTTNIEMIPGSVQVPCVLCGQMMWFAPSGQVILAAGKNPALCIECMIATIKARA